MTQQLKCDRCGATYTDAASITSAKSLEDEWKTKCEGDGVEPRGIVPCPVMGCRGELILSEVKQRKCSGCGVVLNLRASHTYSIIQNEDGSWTKEVGDVDYVCVDCDWVYSVSEIKGILRQVDEL